jgi:putative ATP-dependent endonuclease of OLD family
MRIETLRIKNFRAFADETIHFNDYSCLVGPNGAGKSTVPCALNVFFRETENASTNLTDLDAEDFHRRNTNDPVIITVTFGDLSDEAQQDFGDYFRQGKLIVSAIAQYDPVTKKAPVVQYGQRLGMDAFTGFFKALGDGKKVSELKEIYNDLRPLFGLPKDGTKDAMAATLKEYEAARPDDCVPQLSADQFYGFSKGGDRLAKYIQWVYVPAVKDASGEQLEARNTALGKLLARTVRARSNFGNDVKALQTEMVDRYQDLLARNQHVLGDLSASLRQRLVEWAHPDAMVKLEWRQDERSVRVEEPFARLVAGEGEFEGEIARFGHGLQRSYLLALLHVLATTNDANAPRLILGCEEPELYQHPPQARHLASVLQTLSGRNAQVVITTHSPIFVSGEGFENVRMVRKNAQTKASSVRYLSFGELASRISEATGAQPKRPEGTLAKIHQALQPSLNEMFFTSRLVLVEGLEDGAFISAALHLLGKWDEFRSLGGHIVPTNKKSEMLQPLLLAKHLEIPTFLMFDADGNLEDKKGTQEKHKNDNAALLKVAGLGATNPFPSETLWAPGLAMWHSNIGDVVKNEIGKMEWASFSAKADTLYGQAGNLHKNVLHIAATLTFAHDENKQSASLTKLCEKILDPMNSIPA